RVLRDRIVVERLAVSDADCAAFLASRPAEERAALVERALRIGLLALQDAGVSVNVDVVRREFEGLLVRTQQANERAAQTLEETLRLNFADGDGRLPRTLERFLGDHGALRAFVGELFDEGSRDSAIGRLRELLGSYFDGDASRLAQLLDPTRLHSPLHAFRLEITEGFKSIENRLVAIEAAGAARAAERAKGTAKGTDFEDLLEDLLAGVCRGSGDLFDRTGTEIGAVLGSKKGDFVITVDPDLAGGADLRIVVEAKDRAVSGRAMRDELRDARANRAAAIALVVFTPAHAPAGIAPFDVRAGDVYCVVDPEAPDPATLEGAVRLARLLALATLREQEVEVDAENVRAALSGVREELDGIRRLKSVLTSMANGAKEVQAGLDRMREGILARVADAEAELRRSA
ncbi:MAG TPA: hypothetical protein VFW86_01305, partial [Candidatus Limnocylindrales bacterium]|nr:hypothetical protein [Candidatus Limnocylindrales bacterium]